MVVGAPSFTDDLGLSPNYGVGVPPLKLTTTGRPSVKILVTGLARATVLCQFCHPRREETVRCGTVN